MLNNKYKQIDEIGKGGFGRVILCLDFSSRIKGKKVVLKVVMENKNKKKKGLEKKERDIMKGLKNKYIITYIDSFYKSPNFFIVMEYCENRDLDKAIENKVKSSTKFDEDEIFLWTHQMIEGMKYLHSKEIIHMDIKPKNVFLTKDNNIKLGDLGIAKQKDSRLREFVDEALSKFDQSILSITRLLPKLDFLRSFIINYKKQVYFAGTFKYQSPEIKNKTNYSYKTDVWSTGCTVFEIIYLKKYADMKINDANDLIEKEKNLDFKEILKKMLAVNENERFSSSKLSEEIKSLKLNQKYAEPWINKGLSLEKLNRYDEAIVCYNKAIDLDPKYSTAWINKGVSLEKLNRDDEAIVCYNKAIDLDPKYSTAWINKDRICK